MHAATNWKTEEKDTRATRDRAIQKEKREKTANNLTDNILTCDESERKRSFSLCACVFRGVAHSARTRSDGRRICVLSPLRRYILCTNEYMHLKIIIRIVDVVFVDLLRSHFANPYTHRNERRNIHFNICVCRVTNFTLYLFCGGGSSNLFVRFSFSHATK